jgi:heme-degrading monooxygenase HmoA
MNVAVIWEARFSPANVTRGVQSIQRIWRDMTGCDGYLDHELLIAADDAALVLVVSHWKSREAADRTREEYRNNPNALEADRLAVEPRRRVVAMAA